MVSINLTLFVQLALFLIFLGVSNRYFLRPILRTMDAREAKIDDDEESARQLSEEAERLEVYYARELASARRIAADQVEKARRQALERRWHTVAKHKEKTDTEVARLREHLHEDIAAQRATYDKLLPEIVQMIDEQLQAGGRSN